MLFADATYGANKQEFVTRAAVVWCGVRVAAGGKTSCQGSEAQGNSACAQLPVRVILAAVVLLIVMGAVSSGAFHAMMPSLSMRVRVCDMLPP